MNRFSRKKILVVDDEPTNLRVINQILNQEYALTFARNGIEALKLADSTNPDLILLDVMMPEMTGYQACEQLKSSPQTRNIPVIFVTTLGDSNEEAKGFEAGAVDYISKPISAPVLKARVATHISLVQVEELQKTRLQVIQRLGRASEYKDNETGQHILRMSQYTYLLARASGVSEEESDALYQVAPMHDIGKIGIPDHILQKRGRLTAEERAIMRRHPEIGAEILGDSDSDFIDLAKTVSLTHHEKWDGTGYPKGLSGEQIPLCGRIVAIADVFDALTSERPYKKAWPISEALEYLRDQKGRHFDPGLIDIFETILDDILEAKARWQDR